MGSWLIWIYRDHQDCKSCMLFAKSKALPRLFSLQSIQIATAFRQIAQGPPKGEHGGTVMPKVDEAELGDDFSYIVRIADTDIDGLKPITYGLTSVKGIGIRTSMMICKMSGIDGSRLGGHLSSEEQDVLRGAIDEYATKVPWWMVNRQRDLETNEDAHIIANEVSMTKDDDVSRLAEIKTFRGMRHRSGHKVRGQRLRSNGRRGSALGVQRKK